MFDQEPEGCPDCACYESERQRLKKQIKKLEKDSMMLSALEQAGVDNWEGYSDAYDIFKELEGE